MERKFELCGKRASRIPHSKIDGFLTRFQHHDHPPVQRHPADDRSRQALMTQWRWVHRLQDIRGESFNMIRQRLT